MDWKKLFYKIVFPPALVVWLFTLIATVGMIIVSINGFAMNPLFYLIYALSFYAVCILAVYLVKNGRRLFKDTKQRLFNTKYGNKYMTDIDFKMQVSLWLSLIINIANVALNVTYGLVFYTNWFFILAGYYAILTALRVLLTAFARKNVLGENSLGEWQRARLCAAVLTLINLSLSGAVLMMMYQNRGFTYAGILIYVMAAYAFYHITVAIVDIIRYRKYNSPVINSVKMVKLAAALVSMLSLETAMLNAFGADMSGTDRKIMIAATGAGICVVVTGLSSYMIVRSTKKINELKENTDSKI